MKNSYADEVIGKYYFSFDAFDDIPSFFIFPAFLRLSPCLECQCCLVTFCLSYLISEVNEPSLVYCSFEKPILLSFHFLF